MKVKHIIAAVEKVAPLRFQDEWDNSGLQVGFLNNEVSKVLVCLDITEAIVNEAEEKGCEMIVSHHPLLFKALKEVSDFTYQQRAHTSLDNAKGGVNHKIAQLIGLENLQWLQPKDGEDAGSGLIGTLPEPERDSGFLCRLKQTFGVECLRHSECNGRQIKTVALCGGAGAFLMRDALRKGADCFITGEFHYHDYFENDGMLLAELGHYQSEKFTVDLLCDLIAAACPETAIINTSLNTNPICYDAR